MFNIKELKPQYITNESGQKTGVILSISDFEELVEDMEDLASVAERREEPSISHEKVKEELKKDGLI